MVQLPDELADLAKEAATLQNRSLDQIVAAALSSQLEAWKGIAELKARAKRADMAAFDRILDRVPAAPPAPGDEL
jgi:hypothetical protein